MTLSVLLAALLSVAQPGPSAHIEAHPAPAPQTTAAGPLPWDPTEEQAIEAIAAWHDDPVLFVRQTFGAVPDDWQADTLRAIARDPRVGMSACKGPGKTCVEAWAVWWWEYTRFDAQCICTSITGDNLRDNLWKELATWYSRSPMLRRAFDVRGEYIRHRERPRTWWVSARSWPQDADQTKQADSLAGFHAGHVLVVLDEMGSYPLGVLMAALGIFSNQDVAEAKLLAAWNPTSTSHAAYHVCTRVRSQWTIITITGDPDDPKRSPRISLEWARQMIADYGRDNDWVRVNVLGLFPLVAEDKLLGPDQITTAQGRDVPQRVLEGEASVWGLDVARYGSDRSVLRERVGAVAFRPYTWRGLDGPTLAQRVSALLNEAKRKPDYLFVDVGGVGASAYDHLKLLGWGAICVPVDFGGSPEQDRFHDHRSEMWWRMADWTRKRGCLPSDSNLLGQELCEPTFKWKTRGKRTAFALETKEEMRARGAPSPDEADALCLTFASSRLVPRSWRPDEGAQRSDRCKTVYDPYARREY